MKIDRQEGGEADEAAEADAIEEHQPPGVARAQQPPVVGEGLARRRFGAVLGREEKEDEHRDERQCGEAEHVAPAESHRQSRREQRGEHRPGIAGARESQRKALLLSGIPIGHHRQSDSERGAGDAEHQAQRKNLREAMQPEHPGAEQARNHDQLHHDAGPPGVPLTNQDSVADPQQRPREDGRRDHQAFLAGIEMQVVGDENRQWPKQHPDREAEIEIKETGDESREIASFEKRAFHGYGSQFQRTALPDLIRMRTAISSLENWIAATAARHYATFNRPGESARRCPYPSKVCANMVARQRRGPIPPTRNASLIFVLPRFL